MKMMRKVSKWLLAATLLSTLPVSASAQGPSKKTLDYVALGDSLATGQTPFYGDGPGYPDYLKERFEQSQYTVEFLNLGVVGYTSTALVLDILNNSETQNKIISSELITIDIGANDLIGTFLTNPAMLGAAVLNVDNNIKTILQTIKDLNPHAEVYVMGYYNPLPKLPYEQQATLLPYLNELNKVLETNAVTNGYTFVQTAEVIAQKSDRYLTNPQDIHLSEVGYKVIAKEFWKSINQNK